MANPQLDQYIQSQRAAGVDDATLRKALVDGGWSEADVNAGLSPAAAVSPPAPLASVPPPSAPNAFSGPGPINPDGAIMPMMPMSIVEKFKWSVIKPLDLLARARSEPSNSFFVYVAALFGVSVAANALRSFVSYLKFKDMALGVNTGGWLSAMATPTTFLQVLMSVLYSIVFAIVMFLIVTTLVHGLCRLFKGTASYIETIKALVYTAGALIAVNVINTLVQTLLTLFRRAPQNVFDPSTIAAGIGGGFFSLIMFAIMLWTLYLQAQGLSQYHAISKGKAAASVIISVIIVMITVGAVGATMTSRGGGSYSRPFDTRSSSTDSSKETILSACRLSCRMSNNPSTMGQAAYQGCLTACEQIANAPDNFRRGE